MGKLGLRVSLAFVQHALRPRASLVVALCLSSYRPPVTSHTCAASALATGLKPLVGSLSASLLATCPPSRFCALTFSRCYWTAGCCLLGRFPGRRGVGWLSPWM